MARIFIIFSLKYPAMLQADKLQDQNKENNHHYKTEKSTWMAIMALISCLQCANATEIWSCKYQPWAVQGQTVESEIRLKGKELQYMDRLFPGITDKELKFRVLNYSKLGFVAVSSLNERDKRLGPIVGATVIIVKMPSGEFTLTGVYGPKDELSQSVGVCHKE